MIQDNGRLLTYPLDSRGKVDLASEAEVLGALRARGHVALVCRDRRGSDVAVGTPGLVPEFHGRIVGAGHHGPQIKITIKGDDLHTLVLAHLWGGARHDFGGGIGSLYSEAVLMFCARGRLAVLEKCISPGINWLLYLNERSSNYSAEWRGDPRNTRILIKGVRMRLFRQADPSNLLESPTPKARAPSTWPTVHKTWSCKLSAVSFFRGLDVFGNKF